MGFNKEAILKARKNAAKEALKYVINSDIIGIGTGSTVSVFIDIMFDTLPEIKNKYFVASSLDTLVKLKKKGVKILGLKTIDKIDVYVDSADEVDPNLNMIKGGGAAHTMEKLLAYASRSRVFIVDKWKLVKRLGINRPIPIEVLPEALSIVTNALTDLGYEVYLRTASEGKKGPIISDTGGIILDVKPPAKLEISEVDNQLKSIPGVIETGIFIGLADYVIVGYEESVKVFEAFKK